MSPRTRKVATVVGALVIALVIAAPLALWLLLDQDAFRSRVSAYVKEQTGLELTIAGSIGISLFPAFGVSLADVSLRQPQQAGGTMSARFAEVNLKARLLPLFRGVIDLGGVRANGGSASLDGYELRGLDVNTGAFGGSNETDLSLHFDLVPAGRQTVVSVELESRMLFNIPEQRLELSDARGHAGAMTFTGELRGEQLTPSPTFAGRIETNQFSLRELLTNLGIAYVPAGSTALTTASISGRIAATGARIELRDVTASLDDSTLKGTLARTGGAQPVWDAAFSIDTLDLDRYMPAAAVAAQGEAPDSFASLRTLIARGRLQVGELRAFGLQLGGVTAALNARKGNIAAAPIRANLYNGRGEFRAGLNVGASIPEYHAEGQLSAISVQPLLTDAVDISALSGTGELSFRLDAASRDPSRLMEATRGRVALSVREGRIEGADFLNLMVQARGIADQLRGREVNVQSDPANRTRFRSVSGTAILERGVARSDDFSLDAPDLQAVGGGTIDLVRETIEWNVRASSDQAGDVVVPIVIAGPFGAPTYRVDTGALLKSAAQQELKRQLDRRLKKLFRWP